MLVFHMFHSSPSLCHLHHPEQTKDKERANKIKSAFIHLGMVKMNKNSLELQGYKIENMHNIVQYFVNQPRWKIWESLQ